MIAGDFEAEPFADTIKIARSTLIRFWVLRVVRGRAHAHAVRLADERWPLKADLLGTRGSRRCARDSPYSGYPEQTTIRHQRPCSTASSLRTAKAPETTGWEALPRRIPVRI